MSKLFKTLCTTVLAFGAALAAAPAAAQAFPTRSVTVVSSSAPGGQSDAVLRFLADLMKDRLGQPVLVENRPGGFALVAINNVMSRSADGYTLLFQGMGSAHPVLNKNPQAVDLVKAMQPVGNVYSVPLVVFSRASLPVKTIQELAAYSKQNAQELRYGTFANSFELATGMLKNRLGGELNYLTVPYKGDPPMITALLAKEIDFVSTTPTSYLPHVKAGTIRPLLVGSAQRSSVFPDTPTAAEAGVRDFEIGFSVGLWAPAGTPADVVARLSDALQGAVRSPQFTNYVRTLGAEPADPTPQGLARAYNNEVKFWTEAVRVTGYTPK